MKFTVKNMRWVIRAIEKRLETFDEQDTPNLERPMVDGDEREQAEEANELGSNNISVGGEESPAPVSYQNNQVNEEKKMRKSLSKCKFCGVDCPDHYGSDCPKYRLDRCRFCNAENPDHIGSQCPLYRRRKSGKSPFMQSFDPI